MINEAMEWVGNKDIQDMCGIKPFTIYSTYTGSDTYIIKIARGEKVCPIFIRANDYDDARAKGKALISGYPGYHVGVRKIKRYCE